MGDVVATAAAPSFSSKKDWLQVKALFFDCFGTAVDWRSTISTKLQKAAGQVLASSLETESQGIDSLRAMDPADWSEFAHQWHTKYYNFTTSAASNSSTVFKTIEQHFFDSLCELVTEWKLEGLWTEQELYELSTTWHHLDPWPDSSRGIVLLSKRYMTCTLSNGSISLLRDMADYAKLEWTHIYSAEMFQTFKPNPKVYLGAAEKIGLLPEQCCMVAAHLADLEAAKTHGFKTIYVERPGEESWKSEQVLHAKQAGWIDLWVDMHEQGFLTVAQHLTIKDTS